MTRGLRCHVQLGVITALTARQMTERLRKTRVIQRFLLLVHITPLALADP